MLKDFFETVVSYMRKPSTIEFDVDPKAHNDKLPILLVPTGFEAKTLRGDIIAARPRPLQRKGELRFTETESLAEWVNRHKDPEASALFADAKIEVGKLPVLSLHAVIDYHDGGATSPEEDNLARNCAFRARYDFPLSEQMQAWLKITRETEQDALDQREFAEFLDKRLDEIVYPPTSLVGGEDRVTITDPVIARLVSRGDTVLANPAEMLQFKRGIALNVKRDSSVEVDNFTGDQSLVFEQTTSRGPEKLKVPNLFLIAIPVFVGDEQPVLMAVRLRVLQGGGVSWVVGLHYPERIVDNEFRAAVGVVRDATGLPVFFSTAPAPRGTNAASE